MLHVNSLSAHVRLYHPISQTAIPEVDTPALSIPTGIVGSGCINFCMIGVRFAPRSQMQLWEGFSYSTAQLLSVLSAQPRVSKVAWVHVDEITTAAG